MIIFGTRGVKSTIKTGNFNCPQCEQDTPFRHRKVTKFFTLYFIPLIPLGSAGEYVECQQCKGTFIPRVLENNNTDNKEFMAIYEKAIKHTMVLIMLADGEIDDNEMEVVLNITNKFGHHDITKEELQTYVKEVEKSNDDISTYLQKIGPSLNEHGKEVIIKCAISVAASDGNIDDSEIKLINEMAAIMEMSSTHMKAIIDDMLNQEEKPFSDN